MQRARQCKRCKKMFAGRQTRLSFFLPSRHKQKSKAKCAIFTFFTQHGALRQNTQQWQNASAQKEMSIFKINKKHVQVVAQKGGMLQEVLLCFAKTGSAKSVRVPAQPKHPCHIFLLLPPQTSHRDRIPGTMVCRRRSFLFLLFCLLFFWQAGRQAGIWQQAL